MWYTCNTWYILLEICTIIWRLIYAYCLHIPRLFTCNLYMTNLTVGMHFQFNSFLRISVVLIVWTNLPCTFLFWFTKTDEKPSSSYICNLIGIRMSNDATFHEFLLQVFSFWKSYILLSVYLDMNLIFIILLFTEIYWQINFN